MIDTYNSNYDDIYRKKETSIYPRYNWIGEKHIINFHVASNTWRGRFHILV